MRCIKSLGVSLEAEDQVKVCYQFELLLASLVSKRKMKWIDHPKLKFCHNFTHPHVIPNVLSFLLSVKEDLHLCFWQMFLFKATYIAFPGN